MLLRVESSDGSWILESKCVEYFKEAILQWDVLVWVGDNLGNRAKNCNGQKNLGPAFFPALVVELVVGSASQPQALRLAGLRG
jgi:hypothetical protein